MYIYIYLWIEFGFPWYTLNYINGSSIRHRSMQVLARWWTIWRLSQCTSQRWSPLSKGTRWKRWSHLRVPRGCLPVLAVSSTYVRPEKMDKEENPEATKPPPSPLLDLLLRKLHPQWNHLPRQMGAAMQRTGVIGLRSLWSNKVYNLGAHINISYNIYI